MDLQIYRSNDVYMVYIVISVVFIGAYCLLIRRSFLIPMMEFHPTLIRLLGMFGLCYE